MSVAERAPASAIEQARAALAAKPDGVVEAVARAHGLPTRTVLDMLPADQRVAISGDRFDLKSGKVLPRP